MEERLSSYARGLEEVQRSLEGLRAETASRRTITPTTESEGLTSPGTEQQGGAGECTVVLSSRFEPGRGKEHWEGLCGTLRQ